MKKILSLAMAIAAVFIILSACGEKQLEKTEIPGLSREEVLSLAGIRETDIIFSKVELNISGRPLITVIAYDAKGREVFSKDFEQLEVKGGWVTVAILKSPIIDALRFLYSLTFANGSTESYVLDFPYHPYQQVQVTTTRTAPIASKGEFKILTGSFGQNEQNVYIRIK